MTVRLRSMPTVLMIFWTDMRVLSLVFAFIVTMPVSAHPGGHYHEAYGLASDHAFDESLASFRSIIERTPQHASAWLSIASLLLIQGDVVGARDACLRASGYVDPIAVLACHGRIALAEGECRTAYMRLDRLLSSSAYLGRSDVYTLWAVAVSAELAVMAGDTDAADRLFERVMAHSPSAQVKVAWADHLIATGRGDKVLEIVGAYETNLALLLRRFLALKEAGRLNEVHNRIHQLHHDFHHAINHGDFEHGREYALFYLDIYPRPLLAKAAAEGNYNNQREPEDLVLLHRTSSLRPEN